jgi:GntR family transcriptional regulator, transcriptional repressor for pyruvate dehydrogenase complex
MSAPRRTFPLVPIKQVDVYGEAREKLSALVAEFEPGEQLPSERALAEQLQVSRMVVRQALKVLEYMGRIEIRHGAGTFVRQSEAGLITRELLAGQKVDLDFLISLAESRAAIEVKVVDLAVERASDEDWDRIQAVLDRNEEEHLSDPEVGSLNLLFEAAIARAAGNPVLTMLQQAVHETWVEAWGRLRLTPDDKHRLHAEHLAILKAMRERDADTAVELMGAHVDRTLDSRVASGGEAAHPEKEKVP